MALRSKAIRNHTIHTGRSASSQTRGRRSTKQLRRQEILERAAALMKKKGFGRTSVRDISSHLGFSKANFYHHMTSKEEMLYRISFQILSVTIANIDNVLKSDVAYPIRMQRIVGCFVNLMAHHQAFISVYFEEKRNLTPSHLEEMTKLEGHIVEMMKGFYREGVKVGVFRDLDPAIAIRGILGMCLWMTRWHRGTGRLSPETISQQFNVLLADGCMRVIGPAL